MHFQGSHALIAHPIIYTRRTRFLSSQGKQILDMLLQLVNLRVFLLK